MIQKRIKGMKAKQYKKFPIDKFGNPEGTRYNIERFYHPSQDRRSRVIRSDVDADTAHAHVNDPKTSVAGKHFDGFRKRT